LRFSYWAPEDPGTIPMDFFKKMTIVEVAGDCMFTIRFNSLVYHQFGPTDLSEYAFFATNIHTNEAAGVSGEIL